MSFLPRPPQGDTCDCACHKAPLAVMHAVPCCVRCPVCGRQVAAARLTGHVAAHGTPLPTSPRE